MYIQNAFIWFILFGQSSSESFSEVLTKSEKRLFSTWKVTVYHYCKRVSSSFFNIASFNFLFLFLFIFFYIMAPQRRQCISFLIYIINGITIFIKKIKSKIKNQINLYSWSLHLMDHPPEKIYKEKLIITIKWK